MSDGPALAAELRGIVRGEVRFDEAYRAVYSSPRSPRAAAAARR